MRRGALQITRFLPLYSVRVPHQAVYFTKISMRLSRKIPLAFAASLSLMSAGAFYGIHTLNQAIETYRTVFPLLHLKQGSAEARALLGRI